MLSVYAAGVAARTHFQSQPEAIAKIKKYFTMPIPPWGGIQLWICYITHFMLFFTSIFQRSKNVI